MLKKGWKYTRLAVVVAVLSLAVYDVFAVWAFGVQGTISNVVMEDSSVVPAIPFGLGFVFGHLFWNQKK